MTRRIRTTTTALATLTVAPTLLAQEPGQEVSWFAMFFLPGDVVGVMIIWFLLALSAISIALSLRFLLLYRRATLLPEATRDRLITLIDDRRYQDAIDLAARDPSYLGRLTGAALGESPRGYGAMERAIEEAGDAETARYLRPVEYLNVMGNIAPMIGLFGTVYGMIVAFQALVASGGRPNPVELAAGISTALVTTFWGLVVAIPALACYALIRNRLDALTSEGMVLAEEIISPFKPVPAELDTTPTPAPGPGPGRPAGPEAPGGGPTA